MLMCKEQFPKKPFHWSNGFPLAGRVIQTFINMSTNFHDTMIIFLPLLKTAEISHAPCILEFTRTKQLKEQSSYVFFL